MRTHTKKIALLAVAALALAACGGSSKNASNDSTPATRTKNGALPTQSCATGGACAVGDVGPGGGKVFYVAPSSFTSIGSACGSTCTYLEAAPVGWITASTPVGQANCSIGKLTANSEFPVTAGTSTIDPRCAWSGTNRPIQITGTAIGSGYANTLAMIKQDSTAGRAGTVARAFRGGGKADWYLPSKDELSQMYFQRSAIGGSWPDSTGPYWSSSEYDRYDAWFCWGIETQDRTLKLATYFVRPVRAF